MLRVFDDLLFGLATISVRTESFERLAFRVSRRQPACPAFLDRIDKVLARLGENPWIGDATLPELLLEARNVVAHGV